MNSIDLPAGVLQSRLLDPRMDDAPNYGNTGATIGHELTHAFDYEGRRLDAHGNLNGWWRKTDARQFRKRSACVRDQYAQYARIDGRKIHSRVTLGEDVADLNGAVLAYAAWKAATKGQNLQPIDGLNPEQRFFVGMGQWACGDGRQESTGVDSFADSHSPLKYRINGVVSNMPEFARAFGCRVGQPMVRKRVCRVW